MIHCSESAILNVGHPPPWVVPSTFASVSPHMWRRGGQGNGDQKEREISREGNSLLRREMLASGKPYAITVIVGSSSLSPFSRPPFYRVDLSSDDPDSREGTCRVGMRRRGQGAVPAGARYDLPLKALARFARQSHGDTVRERGERFVSTLQACSSFSKSILKGQTIQPFKP